jgi:glycolate oxidase iron-sulfur subunit
VLWGEEMDSPRGRIHLIKQGTEGAPLSGAFVRHIDLCLGCMACTTACPSGVRYGELLEATRQQVERRFQRRLADRAFRALLFALFPYPARLRVARFGLRAYQLLRVGGLLRATGLLGLLPERVRALESLAPEPSRETPLPRVIAAAGPVRRRVGLLTGCVQRVFFSNVNAATARVLSAEGCTVVVPQTQGCCGALSLHAGRLEEARALARRLIDVFETERLDAVVVNAAGCGSAMKEYGHLLRDDAAYAERARRFAASVRDLSELLAELPAAAPRHPLPMAVAYHDACHLGHAQRIRAQPRALLRAIPGLEVREIGESEICCGSAGIFNLVEPGPARELGERKARNILATGAGAVVSSNPGCLLQVRASLERLGRPLPLLHLAEMLDAAISGRPLSTSAPPRR